MLSRRLQNESIWQSFTSMTLLSIHPIHSKSHFQGLRSKTLERQVGFGVSTFVPSCAKLLAVVVRNQSEDKKPLCESFFNECSPQKPLVITCPPLKHIPNLSVCITQASAGLKPLSASAKVQMLEL